VKPVRGNLIQRDNPGRGVLEIAVKRGIQQIRAVQIGVDHVKPPVRSHVVIDMNRLFASGQFCDKHAFEIDRCSQVIRRAGKNSDVPIARTALARVWLIPRGPVEFCPLILGRICCASTPMMHAGTKIFQRQMGTRAGSQSLAELILHWLGLGGPKGVMRLSVVNKCQYFSGLN